ncbi:hypothetical protein A3C18_01365 [Candidatus Kaiserbacteria bacterium RIFCSPHIGHO2_02_FULL_54_11b]|uniref:HAD family hydrolase n=2 Tax=Candidatus Kaiseribacteriota TaxID=1752734 RepID=A0A1F6CS06_9BACT|nr:MAG: hypothetical protein A2704_05080 [Candidatus Kaiserbacteria bacterium RIFCSPHIGHO2_01_FULL_54_36b]OGG64023.1 MAG: hypothetical protein A3C18_01365 [Candidatus Kaiserbacteria bacterium RIFCSPHIGHO2_02_FULL_54_11b]
MPKNPDYFVVDLLHKTIIFDFDGTIADTQQIMFDTANSLAAEFGFDPIRPEEMPQLKTMSARELVVKRLRVPLWNIWKIYKLEKRGRELFAAHVDDVRVFPGMKEVIAQLRNVGCRVGIVTSNSADVVAKVLQTTTMPVDFVYAGSRIFGKAQALRSMLSEQNIDPTTTLYVGDEVRDVEACKKVGIRMLAVGWGYNDAKTLEKAGAEVVTKPGELVQKIVNT